MDQKEFLELLSKINDKSSRWDDSKVMFQQFLFEQSGNSSNAEAFYSEIRAITGGKEFDSNALILLIGWLEIAFSAGCKYMALDSIETLTDYSIVVSGNDHVTCSLEKAYSIAADALSVYYSKFLS